MPATPFAHPGLADRGNGLLRGGCHDATQRRSFLYLRSRPSLALRDDPEVEHDTDTHGLFASLMELLSRRLLSNGATMPPPALSACEISSSSAGRHGLPAMTVGTSRNNTTR